MTSGGRSRPSRPPARAASTVAPLARPADRGRGDVARLIPGGRSLVVLIGIVLVATAAFLLSTSTSLFAVKELEVRGAPAAVADDVRAALAETRGTSLVGIDLDRLAGLVQGLPTVAAVSFDRAFPHTLRVRVVPERVVGVVRQGKGSYLVAASGRVVDEVARGSSARLPRIWASRADSLRIGARVPVGLLPAVRTVAPLRKLSFPARVASVRADRGDLHLRLASGLDLRLGRGESLMLKLTVAGEVLPLLSEDVAYLDVSVPERPVAGSTSVPEAEPATATPSAAGRGTTPTGTASTVVTEVPSAEPSTLAVTGAATTVDRSGYDAVTP